MRPFSRSGLSVVPAALPAVAFTRPLSPEAIREAYLPATGDRGRIAEVFRKYARRFPKPETRPYATTIAFETPFVVVTNQIEQNPELSSLRLRV